MLNKFFPASAHPYTGGHSPEVRVVQLIEDDPSMRRALGSALREQGFVVEVFASCEAYQTAQPSPWPKVLLLDMRLPDGSGLEIRDWLKARDDASPVIFISGQSSDQEIIDALKGGAQDFLLKPFRLAQLLETVDRAFERQQHDHQDGARKVRLRQRWDGLTRREQEVCVLMLKGMANREIARLHGSVPGTVKIHRARVLAKMGTPSLSDLFRMAAGEDLSIWLQEGKDGA